MGPEAEAEEDAYADEEDPAGGDVSLSKALQMACTSASAMEVLVVVERSRGNL
jgi:hypothetical protein